MKEDRVPRWLGPAALFVFAVSGAAGLIYQSIWSQYLALYLGHAAYAQSLVLALFMGGMAIGAWWASRYGPHWRNLLRIYAAIELVIGLAAALFHPLYLAVTTFAYDTAFPAMPGGWAAQAFKWSSGALLILPQAILLGATFPLMSNGLMRRLRSGDGAILGGLYFSNSLGAAVGALAATFILLPAVGLPGAMRFGAVLNLLVAVIAFLLARKPEAIPARLGLRDEPPPHPGMVRLLLAAAFVTGTTSFIYELGWVRMLSLAFGSTVHAFELMLAAFVGGIGFGGLWIRRRIDGYSDLVRAGGWVQVSMGIAAVISLLLYDRSFDWMAWFISGLSRSANGYALYNAGTIMVSILLMAPAAFFAGMTLPLFTLSLLRNGGGEASVGRAYAANTMGAIVGVFATVHLLIPVFGLKLAMCIGAAGDFALGLMLLRRRSSSDGRADAPYLGALATCGLALVAALMLAHFDPAAMAAGVYRTGAARFVRGQQDVLFYRDGKTASVAVSVTKEGVAAISTNGKVDAAMQVRDGEPVSDEVTMVMAGLLPLLHNPHPRTAGVIGFGSGLSTHTLLGDPRIERVDTIEIEPAMVEGAKLFGRRVERAYHDSRSHIHIEDAKTYFAANQTKYDIIVAEPSNPWVSGVATLFSEEFYHFVPRHLQPGGLFVQWIQLYEINDELVASVMRALSKSFSDYRVYLSADADMLVVARADGMVDDLHIGVLDSPGFKDELGRIGLATADDIEAHELGDRRSLAALFDSASGRINSDFHPFLSLEAPSARFVAHVARAIVALPSADLPYRTVLAGLLPPAAGRIQNNSLFAYARSVQRAERISEALRNGSLPDPADDAHDAAAVSYVRDAVGKCQAGSTSDRQVMDSLVRLAGRTIPYLDATAVKDIWNEPRWIECAEQSSRVHSLLAVLSALARGDWPALQHEAGELLRDGADHQSDTTRDWLLRAAMLSAIGANDFAAVSSIDDMLGKHVAGDELSLQYRAYLLAFAQQQGKSGGPPARTDE
jgi:predicted membrane-bound spermidine synthase